MFFLSFYQNLILLDDYTFKKLIPALPERSAGNFIFSDADLEILWTAILNMFEDDHSAARGKMCLRKLYIFKHETPLGNVPSHVLFDKIRIEKKPNVTAPRAFTDYQITVDETMPAGVTLIQK